MDDRPFLAEALLERLRADRVPHSVLADGGGEATGEIALALPRAALQAVPKSLGGFCRAFDLQLVHLGREERGAWRAVLAWSDDVGRPRFLAAEFFADWHRGGRLLLRAEELLGATPDVRFIHLLLGCLYRERLTEEQGRQLSGFWQSDPRGAMEQIARFWNRPSDMRLVAQAAKHGSWAEASRRVGLLRRSMRGGGGGPADFALRLRRAALKAMAPAGAVIAFVGADNGRREYVRQALARDLAPAFPSGLATVAHGFEEEHARVDVRVILGGDGSPDEDSVQLDPALPLPSAVAKAERAVLRWLECRVERRYPDALVGENPLGARFLQRACRARIPILTGLVKIVFNSDLDCRLRSPILMPHPYGIVIEGGAEIGNRVTILQHASLARTAQGAPTVEDNVLIGAGARIVGPVRIGRGATIGENAVVTRDVPSHSRVGVEALSPRHDEEESAAVVNSGHWRKS